MTALETLRSRFASMFVPFLLANALIIGLIGWASGSGTVLGSLVLGLVAAGRVRGMAEAPDRRSDTAALGGLGGDRGRPDGP
jgi:hypothetical protein